MSNRNDITNYYRALETQARPDFGLAYTCNCSWIDAGHANPSSARNLWHQLINESEQYIQNGTLGFKVSYHQNAFKWKIKIQEHNQDFFVLSGLSIEKKERVALSIFHEVSYGFENLQKTGITGGIVEWWSKSSFSEEDLISNLVGFYRAVKGETYDWRNWCNPVSEQSSLQVWDKFGSTGDNKNKFFIPNYHSCDECQKTPTFPYVYNSIVGMAKGIWHFDFDVSNARKQFSYRESFLPRNYQFSFGRGVSKIPTQIDLLVKRNETQRDFARRALKEAAFLVGLPLIEQLDFVSYFYPYSLNMKAEAEFSLEWRNGDPNPDDGINIKAQEFSSLRGTRFGYLLSPLEIEQLKIRKSKCAFSFIK